MLAMLDAGALALTGVVSRKIHTGVVGNADRVLDRNAAIDGALTVEPRAINSGHSIIFQFDAAVSSVVGASVIDANGAAAGSAMAVPSGSTVIVTLSNVADASRVTIRLNGVNGTFNTEVSVGLLLGDTDNSYSVNGADSSSIKARSGQAVSVVADNYKFDVNGTGRINAADIAAVKSRNGRSLVITPASTLTDVYVAGFENNGTSDVAKVWKNGIASALTDGTNNAEATAVHVSGADVYVAGREFNGTVFVAKVWKNGVVTSLTGGPFNARIVSIFVSGADVYVAGFEGSATNNVAKVWKNGVATSLSGGTNDANAYSVFVSGTSVYVAGYEFNGTYNVAKVWKNGVATNISNGTRQIDLRSVSVSGADVYVAGSENNGTTFEAKVWKNGVATNLTAPASDGNANSVFVSGVDVYVAGSEIVGGTRVAKIWKNGIASALSSGTNHVDATSVFVSGADVHVAGYEQNGATFSNAARVWKNGLVTNLSGVTSAAVAYSVFAAASTTPGYTFGGTLSGLGAGKTVVLRSRGGNNLSLSANGTFTFTSALASGAAYGVIVLTYPAGQACFMTNGSGTIGGTNVRNVNVTCGVAGGNGSLDTTFGNGGFIVHGNAAGGNAADVGQSIAIDASGRIVVSGYSTDSTGHSNIALWRYNANGTLDTSFNGTGVLTEVGISWNGAAINEGVGVAIDSLQRIVVVGYTLTDVNNGIWTTVVWRYNPDGTRDTTFNGVGVANFPFGQMQSIGYSVAIDSSNRIVVGGIAWNGTSWDVAVSRNVVAGDLDTTFNAVGYATQGGAAGGNGEDIAQGVTIDGAGRILLTGGSVNANGASDMTVWRYNADGTLDTTFNATGYFTYVSPNGGTSGRNSVGSTISIDSTGRIVVVGRNVPVANSLDGDLAIWRFTSNGALDTSFNGTGMVTHNGAAGGNGHDDGYAGGIDSTGRIYATGLSLNAIGDYDMVLWRFNANGTLDTSFNGTGFVAYAGTAGGANATDTGRSLKIDSAGRIVVTGSSRNAAGNADMVIWRINP